MTENPTATLTGYALALSLDDAPPAVIQQMKWLILDHVGCALGGSLTPLGLAASAVACADGGSAATVVGTRQRAGPGPAAFANAMAANALDYDDTGATGHPGATVIPAALALGEVRDRSGADDLAAVLAGYEVWSRIAGAIQQAGSVACASTGTASPRPSA